MAKIQALIALFVGVALGCALVSVCGGRPFARLRFALPETVDLAATPTMNSASPMSLAAVAQPRASIRSSSIRSPVVSSRETLARAGGRSTFVVREETQAEAYKRIRESRKRFAEREKRARDAEDEGGFSKFVSGLQDTFDFRENIAEDKGLIAAAKQLKKGDKLSKDEYDALGRRIRGTADGFFGQTVEVKGKYTEKGYVAKDQSSTGEVPYFGVLIFITVAILGTAGVVVTQIPS